VRAVTRRRRCAAAGLAVVVLLVVSSCQSATVHSSGGAVKAVYVSYYGVGSEAVRERIAGLLEHTELNGVVIDVKSDEGLIPYDSRVPLAIQAGARGRVGPDFDAFLARLKARGVYAIARIVVFKDRVLTRHRPAWAVRDARTGSEWHDREGSGWIDPFREEAWSYPIAIAREAALKGFDEIQFDYLRFPSDGRLEDARYARPSTQAARIDAVSRFLEAAREGLGGTGAALAIDVFGYAAFNETDTEVGQRIEDLAPLVDYLCPMTYPSGYHRGIPGYPNPVAHPYEVVLETVRRTRARAAHTRVQVRPWLQDFRDYAFDRRLFGVSQVRAEIKAAGDAGGTGWMLWNAGNQYTEDALARASR
jgi:hypothetical protein